MTDPLSIPRTVCLVTPTEDPVRTAHARAYFKSLRLPVEFVTGLHQSTSGLVTTHPYMVDRGPSGEPFSIGPHPVNIWIGHWMIWNALLLSPEDRWLVLECDARFEDGWELRLSDALHHAAQLPPYDLLYLGSCCTAGRPATPLAGDLFSIAGTAPQCNHAYIVTKPAARILVDTLRKVWAPIDIQQASECWGDPLPYGVPPLAPPARSLVVYTVLPRIVHQWSTEIPT